MDTHQLFHSIRPRYPEFSGQVALITGSTRAIGKGIALRLAREGMKIILHGLDEDELNGTIQEFESLNIDVCGICTDFSAEDGIEQLFEFAKSQHSTLDLLVNNAASLRRVDFFTEHTKLLDYQLTVNIKAPYQCAWHAAQIMRQKKSGNIINISSVGGVQAHWKGLPYDATKGAIDAMTKAMALDLASDHIRVNAVAPGAIERQPPQTPEMKAKYEAVEKRIPLNRFGTALDIGAMIAFLASGDASYITGQILYVDGGITSQLSPQGQPI